MRRLIGTRYKVGISCAVKETVKRLLAVMKKRKGKEKEIAKDGDMYAMPRIVSKIEVGDVRMDIPWKDTKKCTSIDRLTHVNQNR